MDEFELILRELAEECLLDGEDHLHFIRNSQEQGKQKHTFFSGVELGLAKTRGAAILKYQSLEVLTKVTLALGISLRICCAKPSPAYEPPSTTTCVLPAITEGIRFSSLG